MVTHRDTSVLPANKHDIRDINLLSPLPPSSIPSSDEKSPTAGNGIAHGASCFPSMPATSEEAYTSGTHLIRPPAHFATRAPVLQTTNPISEIDPAHVLARARLER